MSWLARRRPPGRRDVTLVPLEPWVPPLLAEVPPEVVDRLSYVVLDEFDGGDVTLAVAPWPRVDALGRVRHAPEDSFETSLPAESWRELLEDRRIPEVLRARPARIGDVFAVLRGAAGRDLAPVGPIVDVTADARDAARAAFYGAVATPLDRSEAEALREAEDVVGEPVAVPREWLRAAGGAG